MSTESPGPGEDFLLQVCLDADPEGLRVKEESDSGENTRNEEIPVPTLFFPGPL